MAAITDDVKRTVQKLPLLTVKAGPREKDEWRDRLKEELACLIKCARPVHHAAAAAACIPPLACQWCTDAACVPAACCSLRSGSPGTSRTTRRMTRTSSRSRATTTGRGGPAGNPVPCWPMHNLPAFLPANLLLALPLRFLSNVAA
eukprot:SAG22_NODE_467_length_10171_cov_4.306295_14_plen_146_part_00